MANWLLPANPKFYNINEAFTTLGTLDWGQTSPIKNIAAGDIAYVYQGLPIQRICWKCFVVKANKPEVTIDDSMFYRPPLEESNIGVEGRWVELKAIYEYPENDQFSLAILKKNGMPFPPQGPRHATDELVAYLSNIESNYKEEDQLENIYPERTNKNPSKKKTTTTSYDRSPIVREKAFERATGKCQLCGKKAPFIDKNGRPFLEIHHIVWLSEGGSDNIHNVVALCPNCHRKMHVLNDQKDIAYLTKLVK